MFFVVVCQWLSVVHPIEPPKGGCNILNGLFGIIEIKNIQTSPKLSTECEGIRRY